LTDAPAPTAPLFLLTLTASDDYHSVREHLFESPSERVVLLWEQGKTTPPLTRRLDLLLILRACHSAGVRIALVTPPSAVIPHAKEFNISVFSTVEQAEEARWKHPIESLYRRTAPARLTLAEQSVARADREGLSDAGSRVYRRTSPQALRRQRLIGGGLLSILSVAVLIVSYTFLPYGRVRVFLARDQLGASLTLTADPSIVVEDIATGRIPAKLVSNLIIQRDAAIQTSGTADIPATVASGTVILTNQTPQSVSVPAGTVVTTLGAKPARFRTLADLLLNGYAFAEVTIQATTDSAGPLGNVEANLINKVEGTLANTLAVRNPTATRGGTIRQQGIVTKTDQTRLLDLLRSQIETSAIADIQLQPSQFIAPGSIKIIEERAEWTTYSHFIGEPTDTVSLTLKVRIQVLVIDETPARRVAYAALSRQLASRRIVVESVTYQRGRVNEVDAQGKATFLMSASGEAVNAIDGVALRDQLAGMGVREAQTHLNQTVLLDPRRPPEILIQPGFMGRLPVLAARLDVEIK
jgi:hypothetical protein